MTSIRWVSFGLAILGVLLCSNFDLRQVDFGKSYLFGNLLIFSGVLGSSFYCTYAKKVMERYSAMAMLFYTYVAMIIIMTPLILRQERDVFARVPHFSLRTWIGLIMLTFFHNYLSMVLFLKALKRLDVIQTALSNYLITFFGVPIAAIFLHERLTMFMMTGGILIFGSTLLITVYEERRRLRQAEPVQP